MPNYCDFKMKVIGYPKNVGEFLQIIKQNYNYYDKDFVRNPKLHLYRVFSTDVDNFKMISDILCELYLTGYCAWSVYSCMLEGVSTYYDDNLLNRDINSVANKYKMPIGTINYINAGTSLLRECKRLNLIIEVFSDEPGMGFQEHYYVNNFGKLVTDEEKQTTCYWLDDYDSWEDFIKENSEFKDNKDVKELFDACKFEGVGWFYYGGFTNGLEEEPYWSMDTDNLLPMIHETRTVNNMVTMCRPLYKDQEYEDIFTKSKRSDERDKRNEKALYESELKRREKIGYKN